MPDFPFPPTSFFRALSFGRFRPWLAVLACLLALAPVGSAQVVVALGSEDECVPSPEDGIFCDEDPGGFEFFSYLPQTISGQVTEVWYVSGDVGGDFYNHLGVSTLVFAYTLSDGAQLSIAGSGSMAYRGTIDGPGSLRLLPGGSLSFDRTGSFVYQQILAPRGTFYSRNTYSGGTEVAGGWLKIYDDASLGSGALTLSAGGTLETRDAGSLRGFTLVGDDTILRADAALSIDGVISGDGRFNKAGMGTVTLTQANTHTGGTRVAEGALAVTTDANLGAADTRVALEVRAALILGDGFTSSARELALSDTEGHIAIAAGTAAWNGATSGPGELVKDGAGTLVLAGTNTHTGGTRVAEGSLAVSTDANLGAADTRVALDTGTTLLLGDGFVSSARELALSGTKGQVTIASGTATWAGTITGSSELIKSGDGTFVLSGAATHTGFTTLTGGTLRTGAAHVLSADSALFINHDATLDLAGHNQTVGDLDSYNFATAANDSGTVMLGGATLTNLTRVTNNWAGALTGSGTFVKQGTATMNWFGSNTFTGTLQIDAGTVSARAANTLSANATVALAAGARLELNHNAQIIGGLSGAGTVVPGSTTLSIVQAANTTFSGEISGPGGALVKAGNGTLTLTGTSHSYTGETFVDGGTLRVNGDISSSSLITVNVGATLGGSGRVGALLVGNGGTLAPGNSPGTLSAGATTLAGGSLFQFELNDATGLAGTHWDLLSISGTLTLTADTAHPLILQLSSLTSVNLAGAADHFDPTLDYSFTFVTTTDGITGFSADAFTVNAAHFANPFSGSWSVAQVNSGHDLSLNYTPTAVPEPSTWAIFSGLGALVLALSRRRTRRSAP